MSIDRGIDTEEVAHIYNGILYSQKCNKIVPYARMWVGLQVSGSDIQSKEKIKYCMLMSIHGI